MEKLLAARTAQQIAAYRKIVPRAGRLQRRLKALADLRTQEGYMAEVQTLGPKVLLADRKPLPHLYGRHGVHGAVRIGA